MKTLTIFLLLAVLPMMGLAGSRGLDIAFLDATSSNTTKEGKRLAELRHRQVRMMFDSFAVD